MNFDFDVPFLRAICTVRWVFKSVFADDGLKMRHLRPVACLLIVFAIGCQQYGEVSPKAYEVAKTLYSICNRQDERRLSKAEAAISAAAAESDLSTKEEAWLRAIIRKARDGEWNLAMQEARLMLSEQVR